MANLNKFLNHRSVLNTSNTLLYTTPVTATTILLSVQVTNFLSTEANVTFGLGNSSVNTAVIYKFPVPGNDAVVLTSKLVLQPSEFIYASSDTLSAMNITVSILETLNA